MWISVLVLREVFVKSTLESADMRIFSDDRPDIQRCGEGEDQAGEQDAWRGEFKLPVLAILKICRTDLDKNRMARIISHTGNTTLLTTVWICPLAAFQVFSIAPATSPAAKVVSEKADTRTATSRREKRILVGFFFISGYLRSLFEFHFRLSFGCGY